MIATDFMEREVFCCGPAPYMNAVKKLLQTNGFDMSRYHEESFGEMPVGVEEEAIENADIAQDEADALTQADMLRVEFSSKGKSIQIGPGETLHAAASKLDLLIPKACGMGICGTCKVLVVEGETEMSHNGGITDEDVAAGYVLSCCSVPKTDVVLDF
jgi:ferredoxin